MNKTVQSTPLCNTELAQELRGFSFTADPSSPASDADAMVEGYLKQQYQANMMRRYANFEANTDAELKTLRQRLNKQSTINLLLAFALLCAFVAQAVVSCGS